MGLKDRLVDIPAQFGAGRMHVKGCRFPIPVFTVNFGSGAPSREEQFLQYNNITLEITEVNKFSYAYAIHCDTLLYETEDGTVKRARKSEVDDENVVYEFSINHNVPRGAHKLFVDARVMNRGQWVLLIRTNTLLFLRMDACGNILRQEVHPLEDIPGMDWKDPPLQ